MGPGPEVARQLEIMSDKIGDLSENVAVLSNQHTTFTKTLDELRKDMSNTHDEVTEIKEYADKWKGGFFALAGVGAFLGALFSMWDHIRVFFRG